jgi:ribonuclease J
VAITLTGYGGVGEIGGNAFLLSDGDTRLALDFGMPFGGPSVRGERARRPGHKDYFDTFVNPRADSAVHDLVTLGLLPPLPGIYRADIGGTAAAPLDGVLLSHPHADHYGYMGFLAPETPFFMSRVAAYTLAHVQGSGQSKAEEQLIAYSRRGNTERRANKAAYKPIQERPIRTDDRFEVGRWQVQRYEVDHSIHGAGAYILQHGDTRIAYSGDLRMHGRHPERTKAFLRAAEDCDALLIEGTRVGHAGASEERRDPHEAERTELDVEDHVRAMMEGLDATRGAGFVALGYPMRDLDRLQSLYHARGDRIFVIQDRQAHLLHHLRNGCGLDLPDPLTDPGIRIHAPTGIEDHEPWDDPQAAASDSDWARTMYVRHFRENMLTPENTVTNEQLKAEPNAYALTLSYWNIQNLIDILPRGQPNQGIYIRSQTQPFNDDMLLMDEKLKLWLNAFGIDRSQRTHVSGHIAQTQLYEAIEEIRPKKLVPIHSEHPDMTVHHGAGIGIPSVQWNHGDVVEVG